VAAIGRIGIRTSQFDQGAWAGAAEAAVEPDDLGCGALWAPESRGREALAEARCAERLDQDRDDERGVRIVLVAR
jgi:hypothetical protein